MSLLRSKALRVFFKQAANPLVDLTEQMRTWDEPIAALPLVAADDALYLGLRHKFNNRYLKLKDLNENAGVLSGEYWDGAAWATFTDFLDETAGLSQSGWIVWEEAPAWKKAKPADIPELAALTTEQELFWVRVKISDDASAETSLEAVKFLLSDDRLLKSVHPEIMQYLPEGKKNFLDQHEIAKNFLVESMIKGGQIAYEEQIKNPEDFLLAASYKAAAIILTPIAGDDRIKAVRDAMEQGFKDTFRPAAASLDTNKNEDLDAHETDPGFMGSVTIVRR